MRISGQLSLGTLVALSLLACGGGEPPMAEPIPVEAVPTKRPPRKMPRPPFLEAEAATIRQRAAGIPGFTETALLFPPTMGPFGGTNTLVLGLRSDLDGQPGVALYAVDAGKPPVALPVENTHPLDGPVRLLWANSSQKWVAVLVQRRVVDGAAQQANQVFAAENGGYALSAGLTAKVASLDDLHAITDALH